MQEQTDSTNINVYDGKYHLEPRWIHIFKAISEDFHTRNVFYISYFCIMINISGHYLVCTGHEHRFVLQILNSLGPVRSWHNFKNFIFTCFNLVKLIAVFRSSYDNTLRWMPKNRTEKSTLVQLMAWCHPATSHYLSQRWHRSMSHAASLGHNGLIYYWESSVSHMPRSYQF